MKKTFEVKFKLNYTHTHTHIHTNNVHINEYNYLKNSLAVYPVVENCIPSPSNYTSRWLWLIILPHEVEVAHKDILCHFLCHIKKLEMT